MYYLSWEDSCLILKSSQKEKNMYPKIIHTEEKYEAAHLHV